MVEQPLFLTVIGLLLGSLSGSGVGGGSLLLLWLTVVLDTPQETARVLNLMFFIPCALTASIFHLKNKTLSIPLVLTAVLSGLAGAVLGSTWRHQLDPEPLRKAFGILFILCGIRELRYRPKELR